MISGLQRCLYISGYGRIFHNSDHKLSALNTTDVMYCQWTFTLSNNLILVFFIIIHINQTLVLLLADVKRNRAVNSTLISVLYICSMCLVLFQLIFILYPRLTNIKLMFLDLWVSNQPINAERALGSNSVYLDRNHVFCCRYVSCIGEK